MSAVDDPIVIVGMARTPMGGLLGELTTLSANELGAIAIKAAMEEAGIAGEDVDQVLMGNVLMAGQGQATHRAGFKYGHDTLKDHMAQDGLEDAYEKKAMGVYADMIAQEYQFTREQQDAYALETLSRAQRATKDGDFKREITPVTMATRKGDVVVDSDELSRKAMPDKIPFLRPALLLPPMPRAFPMVPPFWC